jgi:hypothetical protein
VVKVEEIPEEGKRIDLSMLPPKAVLKATTEKWVEGGPGKSAGLVIYFQDRDGNVIPQKYGKVYGKMLKEALKKLGLASTDELQKDWYEYELRSGRTGFPRYIPVRKAK